MLQLLQLIQLALQGLAFSRFSICCFFFGGGVGRGVSGVLALRLEVSFAASESSIVGEAAIPESYIQVMHTAPEAYSPVKVLQ